MSDLVDAIEAVLSEFAEYAFDGDTLSIHGDVVARTAEFTITRGDVCASAFVQPVAPEDFNRAEVRSVLRDLDRIIDTARRPWSKIGEEHQPGIADGGQTIMFGNGQVVPFSKERTVPFQIGHPLSTGFLSGEHKLNEAMDKVLEHWKPSQLVVLSLNPAEAVEHTKLNTITPLPEGFLHRWAIHELETVKTKPCEECGKTDCADVTSAISLGKELVVIDFSQVNGENRINTRWEATVIS